ncbi:Hypothetical predicted protein [Lecanosticta acicola]|uniref:Uncharacterized protein n=1 Tax=Lecanosticta acicola TaxID=111012 RepID=A0AAI9EDY1_9PEZI|nr:Hypothetical predicted protein [Lecanosticta acicola]
MIPRAALTGVLRQSAPSRRTIQTLTRPQRYRTPTSTSRFASHVPFQTIRWLSSKSIADEKIEEITELYATAQDEFEIAMEETERATVYAEEDRKTAREELTRVQEAFTAVVHGEDQQLADEVRRRVGQRIRELEQGVMAMEELAQNQD